MTARPSYPMLAALGRELAQAVIGKRTSAETLAIKLLERTEKLAPDDWAEGRLGPSDGEQDTSAAAARQHRKALRGLCWTVLMGFRVREETWPGMGLTNSELIDLFPDENQTSVQPRTSDLARAGLIVDSGERRRNARGHLEIVWKLTEAGRTAQPATEE